MNKFYISSIIILFLAVVALFVMQFRCEEACETGAVKSEKAEFSADKIKMAYVNIDSLLLNYQMSKDLNEELLKKQETARTEYTEEARILQNQMRDFQRKIENNGFLSRERAESEQQRLLQKEQGLQEMNGRLSRELAIRQQEISKQLLDSISNYLEIYNKDIDCELILSTTLGGNILFAKDGYNITGGVLDNLNARYLK